jgi:hypothetical protein
MNYSGFLSLSSLKRTRISLYFVASRPFVVAHSGFYRLMPANRTNTEEEGSGANGIFYHFPKHFCRVRSRVQVRLAGF